MRLPQTICFFNSTLIKLFFKKDGKMIGQNYNKNVPEISLTLGYKKNYPKNGKYN